jgi:hypothetical protein
MPPRLKPSHLVAWVCNDYFLDTVGVVTDLFGGDLLTGIVFLAIIRENLRGVEVGSKRRRLADQRRARSAALGQPVTVYTLSQTLGLTYETTRRHVNRLIQNGYCKRLANGLMVPAEVLRRPDLLKGGLRNQSHFQRLVQTAVRAKLIKPMRQTDAST